MTLLDRQIILSHPGKHHHFYQIARAATEANLLAKFVTGAYYLPDQLPYRALNILPKSLAKNLINRLESRRSMPGVDNRLVDSMPYCEAVLRGCDRTLVIRDIIGRRNLVLGYNAVFDRRVASRIQPGPQHLVHCLWGSAWKTFEKAKQHGATTILDMMINPLAYQHVTQEYKGGRGRQFRLSCREQAEVSLADYILSPSEFVSQGIIEMGFPKNRIIGIPYGVEVERFTLKKERTDAYFQILFVGHVALRKGFQYLLEACEKLDLPNVKLTIIGTPVDSASEKVLMGYRGTFTWVPSIAYDELHRYYQNSDLFVFPSLAEGSALVTYEALACGLPSIVTENAGSVVQNGIEGFVVPVRDAQAIQEKIRLLYRDRDLARKMSLAARARAENFSWERYRRRIIDAYTKITNE